MRDACGCARYTPTGARIFRCAFRFLRVSDLTRVKNGHDFGGFRSVTTSGRLCRSDAGWGRAEAKPDFARHEFYHNAYVSIVMAPLPLVR